MINPGLLRSVFGSQAVQSSALMIVRYQEHGVLFTGKTPFFDMGFGSSFHEPLTLVAGVIALKPLVVVRSKTFMHPDIPKGTDGLLRDPQWASGNLVIGDRNNLMKILRGENL